VANSTSNPNVSQEFTKNPFYLLVLTIVDFNHIYTVPMLGTHKSVVLTPIPRRSFLPLLHRSSTPRRSKMKKGIHVILALVCFALSSCVIPTPAYDSWETEAQFQYYSAYAKGDAVHIPGYVDERKKEEIVIRIDTKTGDIEAVSGRFGKKKNEIYSEENGFTRIPKVQRANFINFDQVEATQGEITPAASFERMPSPERIKASFEEYERWILLEMLPRKDSRKARFMLVSREPEIAGRYSKVFEIDLGAIRLREHKKIILFDPFGGFGMD